MLNDLVPHINNFNARVLFGIEIKRRLVNLLVGGEL